jgi:DNA-binding beta-propeller fold protein YncE
MCLLTSVGEALTPDGRYLIVTDDGGGAAVVDVADAEAGRAAVVARLSDPRGRGAIEAAVSPDGHYVFITLENSRAMAVFDLRRALTASGTGSSLVGEVLLPETPVGLAISPDGRFLYATSEGGAGVQGTLSVLDLARAETDPPGAVLEQVAAGCSPVRVITNGSTVWVSARGSNEMLAFSAALLTHHPTQALIASVHIGSEPVGLALIKDSRYLVVADSNRFRAHHSTADLRVIDVAAALAGRSAAVSRLAAGGFPREMTVSPDGSRLLVTDYQSGQLQAIDIAGLP